MEHSFNFACQELCFSRKAEERFSLYLYGREQLNDEEVESMEEEFLLLREAFYEISLSGNVMLCEYLFAGEEVVFVWMTLKASGVTLSASPVAILGTIKTIYRFLVPLAAQALIDNIEQIRLSRKQLEETNSAGGGMAPADEIIAAMEMEQERKKKRLN
ncbi:MAG TPA: hypothetical protein PK085_01955 [bacterium]|nr:hypothetical protein [bacterium]